MPLAKVARTTNLTLANTQFVATLDKPRGVRLLALVRHNMTLDALKGKDEGFSRADGNVP